MKYTISEQAKLPVIWLDTHVINIIAHSLVRPEGKPDNKTNRDVYYKFIELIKEDKLFSFESDQLSEIEFRPELVKKAGEVLTHTSQGVRTHYQYPQRMQLQIAIKAAIEGDKAPKIPWRTAFMSGNPLPKRPQGPFFIRAYMQPTIKQLAERKKTNNEVATAWEAMRKGLVAQKLPEKRRRDNQLKQELMAGQKMFMQSVNKAVARQMAGVAPTSDEFLQELELIGTPSELWDRYGGTQGPIGIAKFYGSNYYTGLPYVEISAELITQKIIGGETIKPSDVMDIHHIAAFLPYCSHMVLDRSMINIVKKLKLDEKYKTQAITLKELKKVLEKL